MVLTFIQKDKSTLAASLSLPSLTCGPKSSDSPSTFNRLHPFFHGGCPGGEDDGGGGESDERGAAAREHHRQPPGSAWGQGSQQAVQRVCCAKLQLLGRKDEVYRSS